MWGKEGKEFFKINNMQDVSEVGISCLLGVAEFRSVRDVQTELSVRLW